MPTVLAAVLLFVLGTALGSFLQTVVDRHQRGENWVKGRSRCDRCRIALSWRETIPLASFIWLRGRCRSCGKRIAVWHLLSEILLGTLFVLVYLWPFALGLAGLPAQLFILCLLFGLFIYDLRYGELPDQFTLPSLAAVALLAFFTGQPLIKLAGAALIGGGFFLVQFLLSKGRWVGRGDSRLGALLGLVVGWPAILSVLFVAYVGGALVASMLVLMHVKTLKDRIPMAGFLIPAALVVLWFGDKLLALVSY
ncbi:MAG: prepilin peptidase [Parcubacteria group bacterium]